MSDAINWLEDVETSPGLLAAWGVAFGLNLAGLFYAGVVLGSITAFSYLFFGIWSGVALRIHLKLMTARELQSHSPHRREVK